MLHLEQRRGVGGRWWKGPSRGASGFVSAGATWAQKARVRTEVSPAGLVPQKSALFRLASCLS